MKAESLMAAMLAACDPELFAWLTRPETILGRVSARTYAVPKLVVDNEGKEREGRTRWNGSRRSIGEW
jgi:hypothetical protein